MDQNHSWAMNGSKHFRKHTANFYRQTRTEEKQKIQKANTLYIKDEIQTFHGPFP